MKLMKKVGLGLVSLASMMTLLSCGEQEESSSSYYWYSTYQAFENTTDNRPYYTFYVDLFNLEGNAIETKKEDFVVTDKNGSYTSVGFVASCSHSSIQINGEKIDQYAVTLADSFTFKKDGEAWNDTMIAFTDNFDKNSAKVTYKGITMTIRPGYTF